MTDEGLGRADVAIVGGGIMGCALAYYLARGGVRVVLLERRDVNQEASGTNAGSLHLQLYTHPGFPDGWLAQTRRSGPLLARAALGWASMESALGADCGVRLGGGLWVAGSADDMALLEVKVAAENDEGIDSRLLSRPELLELAPYLGPDVVGGSFLPGEGFADPLLVTHAFARNALAAGAQLVTHVRVLDIERGRDGFTLMTDRGPLAAERVVSAAGAWTPLVAGMVGLDMPVQADVVQVNVTEPRPALLRDQLVQHVSRGLSLKQSPRGAFILGGGWPGSYDAASRRKLVSLDSMTGNAWVAVNTVPDLAEARIVRTWAGMGARTDDGLPIIGESAQVSGFYVLFSMLGFTLGPITAEVLSEELIDGRPSVPLEPYTPDRF